MRQQSTQDAFWTVVSVMGAMASGVFFYRQLKAKKPDPTLARIDRRLAQLAPLPEDVQ